MGRSVDEVAKPKSGDLVTRGKLSASASVRGSSDVVWNKYESAFQLCPYIIKFFPLQCVCLGGGLLCFVFSILVSLYSATIIFWTFSHHQNLSVTPHSVIS